MRPSLITLLAAMTLCGFIMVSPIRARPDPDPGFKERIELGRRLFYDADLSVDGTMSCATCHEQRHGFADGNATHEGVNGAPGRRNVPGLANVATFTNLTWADPRPRSLEAQVAIPVLGMHPVEMGMAGQEAQIARRLGADPCYGTMFARAFPGDIHPIDFVHASRALAAFERTLAATTPSPASSEARRGARLFAQLGCAECHSGPSFSDSQFHRIEPAKPGSHDRGLAEVTGRDGDVGAFRTPSLVNAGVTQPYLHDGSSKTLAEAILRHQNVTLASDDVTALATYVAGLTDQRFLADPRFSLPQRACGRRI